MPLTGSQRVARSRRRVMLGSRIVHAWGQLCALQALPCSAEAKQAHIPSLLASLRDAGQAYAALPPLYSRSDSDA